jgi:hypothetical protein
MLHSLPISFNRSSYTWRRVQVMKLVMQFSASSCQFLPLRQNILLSTLFPNTLGLCSSLNVRDQVSHPYRTSELLVRTDGWVATLALRSTYLIDWSMLRSNWVCKKRKLLDGVFMSSSTLLYAWRFGQVFSILRILEDRVRTVYPELGFLSFSSAVIA